jgi:16S rRNA pseudouridine516 synthase
MERIDRLLANRGYCPRAQVWHFLRDHTVLGGVERLERENERVDPDEVTVDGQRLDVERLVLLCHKPLGLICSHDEEEGDLLYSLFPERWRKRKPALNTVGRLDKDTTGLLIVTDDGQLLHRLVSPKNHVPRIYLVTLRDPLRGDEAAGFATGTMILDGEKTPLLPAEMEPLDAHHARLTLHEGRYHQVRRMFEATGNFVEALHRERFGALTLGGLKAGEWRLTNDDEISLASLSGSA